MDAAEVLPNTASQMEDPTSSDRTETMPESDGSISNGYTINVIGESVLSCYPLPLRGEAVIGRSADATIAIDHPSISRRHALLRTSPALTIEDLGSINGTCVNGKRLMRGKPPHFVLRNSPNGAGPGRVKCAESRPAPPGPTTQDTMTAIKTCHGASQCWKAEHR